jgi:UDP-N-acetylglucosamine transferase subunit ALG13
MAGVLSHPAIRPRNIHYIGILSRFSYFTDRSFEPTGTLIDLVALLSGPEPQRTILEKKLLTDLQKLELKAVVVQGKTEISESFAVNERIHCFSHLGTQELARLFHNTDLVICRSGYSSIMDLVTLGKRAVLIPTPGQTEQEYLARYLMNKKIYFSMKQDHFDLVYALEMAKNFPGMMIPNDYSTLKDRIRELSAALFPHSPADEKQPGHDER